MNAVLYVASILAVALTAVSASGQSLTWTQLGGATNPAARSFHAMAFDSQRGRVVLFGGGNTSCAALGDTWEWDGINWTQVAAAGPSARLGHAMAYDAARQRVLLFGGWGGSVLGDTWEWDGTNWMQSTPSTSPSSRRSHAMAYDAARQRVVLFGGYSSTYVNDTWEWDGTNWIQRSPTSNPLWRDSHSMAYDAARQRVILFGGGQSSVSIFYGDTWAWDGINWTQVAAAGPAARDGHAMAYDAARQKVVLFGGGVGHGVLGDTWEWNGTNWMQWQPSVSPSGRRWPAMAYDAARGLVVLFGGAPTVYTCSYNLADTWVAPAPTIASGTAYGAGCGSPPLGFVPDPNGRPVLGHSGRATIVNAPTSIAAVATGWSNQFFGPFALPMTLAGIGMPGCDLLQSADILGLGTSPLTPSTLSFSLAIPSVPSLVGMHLYLQAYAFAPGVSPLQIIISNGVDWMLGNI